VEGGASTITITAAAGVEASLAEEAVTLGLEGALAAGEASLAEAVTPGLEGAVAAVVAGPVAAVKPGPEEVVAAVEASLAEEVTPGPEEVVVVAAGTAVAEGVSLRASVNHNLLCLSAGTCCISVGDGLTSDCKLSFSFGSTRMFECRAIHCLSGSGL
jgi:hypothetical protein